MGARGELSAQPVFRLGLLGDSVKFFLPFLLALVLLLLGRKFSGCEIGKVPPLVLLPGVLRVDSPLGTGQRRSPCCDCLTETTC